jgi:hypothetical protein
VLKNRFNFVIFVNNLYYKRYFFLNFPELVTIDFAAGAITHDTFEYCCPGKSINRDAKNLEILPRKPPEPISNNVLII